LKRSIIIALFFFFITVSSFSIINPIPFKPKSDKSPSAQKAEGKKEKKEESSTFSLTFDSLETIGEETYKATGNVRYENSSMILTADSLIYDKNNNSIHAEGNVSVNFQDFTISGDALDYNTKDETGTVYNARGTQKDGDYTIIANRIKKIGEDWYEVEDGIFTSCNSSLPPWSLKISRGKFHLNNYAFLHNPRFKVRDFPIVYSPYIIWPIKEDRSTGFLLPSIGSSNTKGFTLGTAFYYAPKDYFDTTFYYDYYKKAGNGIGNEFRYALTEKDYGYFSGYYIKDKLTDKNRWFLTFQGISDFSKWKSLIDIHLISDADFFRDYNRDYAESTKGNFDSTLFLTRQVIGGNLNFYLQRSLEYYDVDTRLIESALPKIEFRFPSTKLPLGIFTSLETSFTRIYKQFYGNGDTNYSRLDFHPHFEFPLKTPPSIDIIPSIELRGTYYSKEFENGKIESDSLFRRLLVGKLDFKGPRFFKKFKGGTKHILEPFVEAKWESYKNDDGYPLFDDVDILDKRGDRISYGIRNRFYSKVGNLSVEANIYQEKNFDNYISFADSDKSKYSPLVFEFKYWPKKLFSLDFKLSYHPITHKLEDRIVSVAFSTPKKEQFFRISYYYSNDPAIKENFFKAKYEELLLAASLRLFGGKTTIEPHIERDLVENTFRNSSLIFWYHGSCYNIGFEGGRREIGSFSETSFRVLISLKQVGNVVDLFGGSQSFR
jgi:LPS-assembly protein